MPQSPTMEAMPSLTRVISAGAALGLAGRVLLHAGPPFRDPANPSPPALNAAAIAAIHEGWASDIAGAAVLIRAGGITLAPAQNFGAVLPLASVIGPSATLVEAASADGTAVAWSELSSGPGPMSRFGAADPKILDRLRFRETRLKEWFGHVLAQPIPLLPLAIAGLAAGDDLHGQTTGATIAFTDEVAGRGDSPDLVALLGQSPLFFLTLWMAGCRALALHLAAAQGRPLVTALAGNGQEVGLQRSDRPGEWITCAAVPPIGPGDTPSSEVSPAVGDSGIIDAIGFGGQSGNCPAELQEGSMRLGAADLAARRAGFVESHPDLDRFGIRLGLDPTRIAGGGAAPLVVIVRVGRDGGFVGRGVYLPPAELFAG